MKRIQLTQSFNNLPISIPVEAIDHLGALKTLFGENPRGSTPGDEGKFGKEYGDLAKKLIAQMEQSDEILLLEALLEKGTLSVRRGSDQTLVAFFRAAKSMAN